LSSSKPDTGTLKSASTWSYIIGVWYFIAVILVMAVAYTVILPMIPIMGSGTIDMSQIMQMLNAFLEPMIAVIAVTIPISIMFGYYSYKVGRMYNLSSLKLAGISIMIVAIAVVPLTYSLYVLFQDLPSLMTLPPVQAYQSLMSLLFLMIGGVGLAAIFGLIFLIAFIIGLSNMKNATGVGDFGTAMWLTIAGFLISITFPIGIILYGSGLSKLARQGGERKVIAPAAEEGAQLQATRQIVYCPYCGAKVEADALFCPTCGSSLKKGT
jgi:hypothetical protein